MYVGGSDLLAEGGSKFYNRCSYTVDSHMAQMPTRRLARWLAPNHFFVKMTKFDQNERSTKGMLIGSEASHKPGFGNRDAAIDDMAGGLAGWHFAPMLEPFARTGSWSSFDQQLLPTIREGNLSRVLLNNWSDSPIYIYI